MNNVQRTLQDELTCKISQNYFWVDSMPVLCWIKNVKPWIQYIRHRVTSILSVSDREQWHHCPGTENPADLLSRSSHVSLAANHLWWDGPEFLKWKSEYWPKYPLGSNLESNPVISERAKHNSDITHAMVIADSYSQCHIHKILDISRFGKKDKLLRTIAWVMIFICNLKSPIKKEEQVMEKSISVDESNEAEMLLVRSLQNESFSSEMKYLIAKVSSKPPLFLDAEHGLATETYQNLVRSPYC